jgi:hypothetical protein
MLGLPRMLLAVAAAALGFGGIVHAMAFRTAALPGIERSSLSPFLGAEFKVLWLADSTTLVASAVIFGCIAFRPALAGGSLVMLLALVPGATTALLYYFLGGFYAVYLLAAASAMAFAAGLLMAKRHGTAGAMPS